MSTYATELGPVIFNPETRAYEALVTFREGAHVERYPCSLRFPMDAEHSVVTSALIRQAREQRNRTRVALRSRLRPESFRGGLGPSSGLSLPA